MRSGLDAAVVGAGLMGRWHARYARASGARVVAVVDVDAERARALAGLHPGARIFDGISACLREARPRVVHVCTPASRVELARESLEAGAHVLVEKPAARSRAEAASLKEAAARGRVGLCPVHQFGFQDGFRRLLRERSALGDLVAVSARAASAGGEGRPDSERREILLDMAPHYLSLFRALGGPLPSEGWTVAAATNDDLEATGRVGGLPVSLSLSLRGRPRRNELLVVGTKASARADLYHGFVAFERGGVSRAAKAIAPFRTAGGVAAAAGANLVRRLLRGEPAFPGLRRLIDAFYRSASEGGPPPLAAEEVLETAAVLEGLEAELRREGAA